MFARLYGVVIIGSILVLGYSFALAMQPQPRQQEVLAVTDVRFEHQPGLPDINQVLAGVNAVRKESGLPALVASPELAEVAQLRANDLANRQYYAHQSPEGTYYYDLLAAAGIKAGYSCENLDIAFTTNPETYVQDWLESRKGHKECLLDSRVRYAGYGTAELMQGAFEDESIKSYVVVAIHAERQE